MKQTQNENTESTFEIVKHPIIYYEVCVYVHNNGTRTTSTQPIDMNGFVTRCVPDGATIIACVPAIHGVEAVYMVDGDDTLFIGYDVPGTYTDWQHKAREHTKTYGVYED